jgi:hypothetical protein
MVDRDTLLKIIENSPAEAPVPATERCRSLRSKGMYINAGLAPSEHITGDGYFWCAKTQRCFGPDEQFVGDGNCRHTGRSCYEDA